MSDWVDETERFHRNPELVEMVDQAVADMGNAVKLEVPDKGPWNRVPNRKMRREAQRDYGQFKPLRSRVRRGK